MCDVPISTLTHVHVQVNGLILLTVLCFVPCLTIYHVLLTVCYVLFTGIAVLHIRLGNRDNLRIISHFEILFYLQHA